MGDIKRAAKAEAAKFNTDDLATRIRGALSGQNCLRPDADYDDVLGIILGVIEKFANLSDEALGG